MLVELDQYLEQEYLARMDNGSYWLIVMWVKSQIFNAVDDASPFVHSQPETYSVDIALSTLYVTGPNFCKIGLGIHLTPPW